MFYEVTGTLKEGRVNERGFSNQEGRAGEIVERKKLRVNERGFSNQERSDGQITGEKERKGK